MTSERNTHTASRDAGFTLPELLVSIIVTGILVAALSMAAILVIRQTDNNQGRLNNTRAEQSVGIWMPSDLSSAEDVDTDPAALPCGTQCPADLIGEGSNALMVSWTGSQAGETDAVSTVTTVSYRYERDGDAILVNSARGRRWPTNLLRDPRLRRRNRSRRNPCWLRAVRSPAYRWPSRNRPDRTSGAFLCR